MSEVDYFFDKYDIPLPEEFDFNKKYLIVNFKGVKYIKLRMKDSVFWGDMLSEIFGVPIKIIKDYDSSSKTIKDLYARFYRDYRIPSNYLEDILKCKYFNYYYTKEEQKEYYDNWICRSGALHIPYTHVEYEVYNQITLENCYIDIIQHNKNHYMDEGCMCKACNIKRETVKRKLMNGETNVEKILHDSSKTELIQHRIHKINDFNQVCKKLNVFKKKKKVEMKNMIK